MSLLRNNTSNRSIFTPKTFNGISAFAFQKTTGNRPDTSFFLSLYLLLTLFYSPWHRPPIKTHGFLGNLKEAQEQSAQEQALVIVKLQIS